MLAGTACQLAMAFPVLHRLHIPIRISFHWRDPRIRRILLLMLPVTIGLGLINFNLLINTFLGSRVSEEAPAAIDKAFRIYMLPQGMFSVAVATVLFPALSRLVARQDFDGLRAHAGQRHPPDRAAADPVRGDHRRAGDADHAARLPARRVRRQLDPAGRRGAVLVQLQPPVLRLQPAPHAHVLQPPAPVDADRARRDDAADQRRRVGGPVQPVRDRRRRHRHGRLDDGDDRRPGDVPTSQDRRLELPRTINTTIKILIASAILGVVTYGTWYLLDQALGRSLLAQLISVGGAITLGSIVYAGVVLAMRVPEARQIVDLFARRFRGAS